MVRIVFLFNCCAVQRWQKNFRVIREATKEKGDKPTVLKLEMAKLSIGLDSSLPLDKKLQKGFSWSKY